MKVTVCQIDPRNHNDNPLVKQLDDLAEHIKSEDSDFLLLPEMGFSSWLAADYNVDVTRWNKAVKDHDEHIANLSALGARAVVGTRPVTKEDGNRRNQAYIWDEDQEAFAFHDKYYLPNEEGYWEHRWYQRGPKIFDIARALGMRIGVQICTEMWFMEWSRHYGALRADMICVPRATPHGSVHKWLAGGQAVAVCSGAYCLSSNLWCPPGDKVNCGGLAWVVDPEGNILAQTDENNPFATVGIDLEFARESKNTYPRYVPE
ncbi:carbon-nitrogen hydrolase family protein [Agarilytica rhodophyticola]|uniref:carbon-nitrogen hydrolase family protein n=1 Tax=Agarilytica rhodophyticola TaxID=1737490 RepID=UPI000B34941F|nr:carbon-nitrogen hydrolase family protein [Agarilytica rhodophyticola]